MGSTKQVGRIVSRYTVREALFSRIREPSSPLMFVSAVLGAAYQGLHSGSHDLALERAFILWYQFNLTSVTAWYRDTAHKER
jgi:hypothetical protein